MMLIRASEEVRLSDFLIMLNLPNQPTEMLQVDLGSALGETNIYNTHTNDLLKIQLHILQYNFIKA